jgi:fermentation-respiration switch protein FrsA (DUF1100 family)
MPNVGPKQYAACDPSPFLKNCLMTATARRKWLAGLGVGAALMLFLFMLLRWFETKQTYHPSRTLYAGAAELGRPWEDVNLTTADGIRLHAWYFPALPHSPRTRLSVIVCHGNGGNISHRLKLYDILLRTGVNVLAFDYRGYGLSQGRPGESGTYLDAQAAYAWLRKRGFSGKDILAYGESLGGGVASELALREPCGGLILQSTFTSVTDLAAELYPFLPVRLLGSIRYDTRSRLPQLHVPVLVLHSRADSLIAFQHAERNFAAANEPKFLCEITGDHNDATEDAGPFAIALETFLSRVARQP